MPVIEARGLRRTFNTTVALDGINLRVEQGRILGLIGPNGAGKTTALHAILGLTPYEGELRVLGHNPWVKRDQLMRAVSFIADVAIVPRWLRVFDGF
jgi:ABC-2 type transport system ATP-binding protein